MKWIQTNEKLPRDEQSVLVSCADGVKEAVFWAAKTRGNRGSWFFEAPYYGQDLTYPFEVVTHWMELPHPPNK